MAIAVTPPYNQYSGSPTNWIPKLYAKKVRTTYYDSGVLPAISNTDYVGNIKDMGDEVIVRTRPTVTVSDYTKGSTISYESLTSDSISILIDKAKKYAFLIDAIDEKQADTVLSKEFIEDSAHQMEIAIETAIFADIYNDGSAYNYGATAGFRTLGFNLGASGAPLLLTKSNIIDALTDLKTVLTEYAIPDDGKRWIVLPPWCTGLIDKSDIKNASFSGEDKSRAFKNKYVATIAGFNIHESNLLSTASDGSGVTATNIIFGHRDALCFVNQLVKNSAVELESTFGTGYKGLQVYGYKVVQPKALGWLYAAKG